MSQKFFASMAVTACLGVGMVVGASQPSAARVGDVEGHTIMVRGKLFEGNWAYVRERPYVSVNALERALGLPHHHDTRNWYLGQEGNPSGSNLQMAVEYNGGKLPAVNYGGTTLVELQSACRALHVNFHFDPETMTYWVGGHDRY